MIGLICCTLECNLACTYCYEGNGLKREMPSVTCINQRFSDAMEDIIRFIDELVEHNGESLTEIIWHGGEPLLIHIDLLEKVMKDQKEKKHRVRWAIQTNGTLLTQRVCEVFKAYHVSVGVSIDGLKAHHDRFRVMKNGRGTYDLIVENIRRAQEMGVVCGALITITDANVHDLNEIYHSFAAKNLNFNFNALFPTPNKGEDTTLNAGSFAKAICDLFDLWAEDESSNIKITPFEQIIEGLLKPTRGVPACHWSRDCSRSFVAMDCEGDLYPCEHWVGNKAYCFGNIKEGLENALKKNTFFTQRTPLLENSECGHCSIFPLCYGGCPWNGMVLTGDHNRKDASICAGRKIIIEHIYHYMQRNWKQNPFGALSLEAYLAQNG